MDNFDEYFVEVVPPGMAKLKTKKAVLSRFKITKDGRFLHHPVGQDHFRAKKSGKRRRHTRGLVELSPSDAKVLKKYLPYL